MAPLRSADRAAVAIVGIVCVVALFANAIAPGNPFAMSNDVLQPPSSRHPFGTDDLGRDLFRAVIHGTRASLAIAVGSAAAAVTLGVLIGGAAGSAGGLIDEALMRLTELFQVVPRFFLTLAAAAMIGSRLGTLTLLLGLTSWTTIARTVRAQVLSIRELDHVAAARAAGASASRVLARHILPLTVEPVIALASLQASGAIIIEAGVSFLGLGDPTAMTWGALLRDGHHLLRAAWWTAVFPGVALTTTVLGIHLLSDAFSPGRAPARRAYDESGVTDQEAR
jgi:peptide/nickel transport system permease protein